MNHIGSHLRILINVINHLISIQIVSFLKFKLRTTKELRKYYSNI